MRYKSDKTYDERITQLEQNEQLVIGCLDKITNILDNLTALAAAPAPTDTGEREPAFVRSRRNDDGTIDLWYSDGSHLIARLAADSSDTPEGQPWDGERERPDWTTTGPRTLDASPDAGSLVGLREAAERIANTPIGDDALVNGAGESDAVAVPRHLIRALRAALASTEAPAVELREALREIAEGRWSSPGYARVLAQNALDADAAASASTGENARCGT